jgi:hypothetical protein
MKPLKSRILTESLKKISATVFIGSLPENIVSLEEQERELILLEKTKAKEKFYFIVHLDSFRVSQLNGVKNLLGFNEDEFDFDFYLNLIHPSQRLIRDLLFSKLINYLLSADFKTGFGEHYFVSFVALKSIHGDYALFKQFCTVFQHDNSYRATEYLNELIYFGPYTGQPYEFRISDRNGGSVPWEKEIRKSIQTEFNHIYNPFSNWERLILEAFASHPNLTQAKIAELLSNSKRSISAKEVSTYCRRIMKKANEKLGFDCKDASQLANVLKKAWLIG